MARINGLALVIGKGISSIDRGEGRPGGVEPPGSARSRLQASAPRATQLSMYAEKVPAAEVSHLQDVLFLGADEPFDLLRPLGDGLFRLLLRPVDRVGRLVVDRAEHV